VQLRDDGGQHAGFRDQRPRERPVAPGGIDREIAAETRDDIQSFATESGAALDASYVDREMLAHLRALGLIDRLLAPSVHDPRVGDLLARIRGVVAEHAQAVASAQAELEGTCGSIDAR
jgi:predicted outer membrane protein